MSGQLPRTRIYRAGRVVPLSALPPLPAKTQANTAYIMSGPGAKGRRPMNANGATISYFADWFGNSNCNSVVGTLIPVGCDVYWWSTNLPSGSNWEDCYVAASATTATCYPPTYSTGNSPFEDTPNMNSVGTYLVGTIDTSTNQWETVVYFSVGNVNVFGTYADSAATIPQQQFTASSGTNVYINASGLTQNQSYVVYVESTSNNVYCQYIAPPGAATPNPTGTCNPTSSSGITAVVGAQNSAAITAVWPLSNTTPTGTYAVVLYDLTTGQRLAMRQVSITKNGSSASISLVPTAGNTSLGTNWPTPPPSPGSVTKFPFDSTSEQSDKSWTMTATGLSANKSYTFTVTDPIGAVVSGPTTVTTNSSGTATSTFTFGTAQQPLNYASNVYTVQMLNSSTNAVDASKAFQILGYNVLTQFQNTSTLAYSTALVLTQGSSATDNLVFTNNSDTLYGTGNGDTFSGFAFNTGSSGITTLLSGSVSTMTVADSAGNAWTVNNTCYGGSGAKAGCTITAYPVSSGTTLAPGAYLSIPSVQFSNAPGNSNCTSGCSALTSVLPTYGASWSNNNSNASTNTVYFTNSFSNTYAGTASVTHIGYLDAANNFYANQETHGYTNNETNATYTDQSPFAPTSGYADVFSYTLTNNSSGGTSPITEISIAFPVAFSPGGTLTTWGVYNAGSGNWQYVACPSGTAANAVCLKSSTGISAGGTDTLSIGWTPPPPSSFSFTDWTISVIKPTQYSLTPSGSFSGFVPSTSSYDTTATAAYSLNGNLITPAFSPTSTGQNTNNAISLSVTNTSTAQDAFPDYVDLIAVDIPSANPFTITSMTTGWSLLKTQTVGTNTRYFFGLCAAQVTTSTITASVTSCGSATEANSIAPGSTFTASGNLQAGTSNITATMYAHGADVNGWSAGHTFSLNVTAVAASAGFSAAGGYPTAGTVSSGKTPQIGADSDSTYGNSYSYVIQNNSATGQYVTSAKIVIPGLDVSSVLPADGTYWKLTNTPTISSTNYGCTVQSSTSANRAGTDNGYGAYNGGITIGGASCKIPPTDYITISFSAFAPYTVNDTYYFPTTVNGSVSASEEWQTDTYVQIILSASLIVSVNPSNPGPGGSTPVVSCVVCSFNTGTNTIDYGSVANPGSVLGSDVVRVSIYTNAGSNNAWKLYVDTNSNPANTAGTYTNELVTSVDSSNSAPKTGITFAQTSLAVVPTTSPGLLLMDNGTGLTATRTPYDGIMNFEVYINGGPTTAQTSTVTYTFIAN